MSRSQSHAKNDPRPHGRYNVSPSAGGFVLLGNLFFFRNRFPLLPSLTNDGNAILREIDVAHPAAKNMIELSRTQDEECGDGTTSVIVLGTPSIRIYPSPYPQA
jgi:hypothetical protein